MYAIVTPARDEERFLPVVAQTVIAQTLRPSAWIIVDDGSRDGTARIARELEREHPWIRLLASRSGVGDLRNGRRQGRDLLSIQHGLSALPGPVDIVAKLDADVTLPPDYFERLAAAFAADDRLGIASGCRCEYERGRWRQRHLTGSAVEGPCRTYRWSCWESVQPLEPRLGWDGVDEARAVLAGWTTLAIPELSFRHHRPMGRRDGSVLRGRAADGLAAHYMGYRPSYLLLRCLWRARRDPYAFAALWGWATAVVGRHGHCSDQAARAYVRRQQSLRHLVARAREARGLRLRN